jgi:hypothetical protein
MHQEMSKDRTIQLADPSADGAKAESVAMIAIAALGIGFVLALALAQVLPGSRSSVAGSPRSVAAQVARAQLPVPPEPPSRLDHAAASPEPHAPRVDPPPAQPLAAAPEEEQRAEADPNASVLSDSEPVAAAPKPLAAPVEEKPAVTKRRATKTTFEPGVLAYVRCEGSERPHARFPCPRDRKLEAQVWSTLEALPACETDAGIGSAELRLVLRRSQIQTVEWKPGTVGPSLNLHALSKCAGAKLADVRTRLTAPEGLVSFRFSLK